MKIQQQLRSEQKPQQTKTKNASNSNNGMLLDLKNAELEQEREKNIELRRHIELLK